MGQQSTVVQEIFVDETGGKPAVYVVEVPTAHFG
jgi:hypothetical protein